MEGSDNEFSDFEFDDPEGRVHASLGERLHRNNSEHKYLPQIR